MNQSQLHTLLHALEIEFELKHLPSDFWLDSVASVEQATSEQAIYIQDSQHATALSVTKAGLVITTAHIAQTLDKPCLVVDKPRYVFAKIAQQLYKKTPVFQGAHPSSTIAETAQLDVSVTCESGVHIGEHSIIGANTWIHPNAVIYDNVRIGRDCLIGANAVIHAGTVIGDECLIESGVVIGGDGFGWEMHQGQWHKVPQVGRVIMGNRVSVGNNTCIDCGALSDTIIGDDVIIDNLVHVAHNVELGQGTAIAGQVGFAGSTKIGRYNTIAGQAGFAGHLSTPDNCHFLAKAGVTGSVSQTGAYAGFPHQPYKDWQKMNARQRQLDKMAKQLKQLQKQIDALSDS